MTQHAIPHGQVDIIFKRVTDRQGADANRWMHSRYEKVKPGAGSMVHHRMSFEEFYVALAEVAALRYKVVPSSPSSSSTSSTSNATSSAGPVDSFDALGPPLHVLLVEDVLGLIRKMSLNRAAAAMAALYGVNKVFLSSVNPNSIGPGGTLTPSTSKKDQSLSIKDESGKEEYVRGVSSFCQTYRIGSRNPSPYEQRKRGTGREQQRVGRKQGPGHPGEERAPPLLNAGDASRRATAKSGCGRPPGAALHQRED